jgi:hypothetical protein
MGFRQSDGAMNNACAINPTHPRCNCFRTGQFIGHFHGKSSNSMRNAGFQGCGEAKPGGYGLTSGCSDGEILQRPDDGCMDARRGLEMPLLSF